MAEEYLYLIINLYLPSRQDAVPAGILASLVSSQRPRATALPFSSFVLCSRATRSLCMLCTPA